MTLSEFDRIRQTLDSYLAKAAESRKHLLEAPYDPKLLHAWRVNLRRVTATLKDVATLSDDDLHDVLGYLRASREASGRCRDIDILALETLPAFLDKEQGKLTDADALRKALGDLQQQNHKQALAQLKKHSMATPLQAWSHWVHTLEPPTDGRIRDIAAAAIEKRLTELKKRAGKLDGGQKRLHRLRSATKKLRYSMELYQHAFPKPATTAWLKRLADLQSHLGLAHDRMMARKLIGDVVDGKEAKAQLKAFRRWTKRTAYEASEKAMQSLAKLDLLKAYWRPTAN
ncbi:CHAD domain-containing protein [Dyella telluris]|uniref:CHAD domain-containing protein n=1 Tax=Dyella telluris TaxID=2763498 RepID=A0A7G8Q2Z3_9GAMM|nr:CHAD domain-containing protein [Dyella telluris]QNK01151.1 CHAD domain-containing protein [Dyella telluris]